MQINALGNKKCRQFSLNMENQMLIELNSVSNRVYVRQRIISCHANYSNFILLLGKISTSMLDIFGWCQDELLSRYGNDHQKVTLSFCDSMH